MKYTAITIGPIYKTINQARKTREIWAASFLFSRGIMQEFIDKLLNQGIAKEDFIVPYPDIQTEGLKEIGLFPDRLIVRESRKDMFEKVAKEVLQKIKSEFHGAGCSDEDAEKYLKNYFYINIVEEDIPEGENVIDKISQKLAISELSEKIISRDPDCITKFLLNITKTDLHKSVYAGERSFPSLIEISTGKMIDDKELLDKLNKIHKETKKKDNQDDDIIEKIKNHKTLKKHFKQAHKYIAIVQSDGDNVGKLIEQIYKSDTRKLPVFSKALADFARNASKKIKDYGGYPVYAGGDDLLFFAPVITFNQNIFTLLNKIDDDFNKIILQNQQLKDIVDKMDTKPSMSYGVSITYYKFPLYETRNLAYKMLTQKAKEEQKNKIAYYWQKHSGQSFEDTIGKNSDFYKKFVDLIKNNIQASVLSSFIYNLNEHQFILKEIINQPDKLKNYFDNFYDESEHKTSEVKAFKKLLIDLLQSAYSESGGDVDKTLNKVYNVLRFYKFLNEKAQ